MDCLECKICNTPYDEEDHRPRNAPCGHDLCTACLRELIKVSLFECPKCRQITKVNGPDDLPVSFGLIDVIRAFKSKRYALTKEVEPNKYEALNDEVCKVHDKAIGHRCLKCEVWICDDCLDSHSIIMGCSTISSPNAMKTMKEKHTKDIRMLLTNFKENTNYVSSKIQEHINKRNHLLERIEMHGEEVEKLYSLLEQGNIHKEKLIESENLLNSTTSPYAMMDKIEVLTHRKQLLRSWSVKNNLNTTASPYALVDRIEVLTQRKLLLHSWFVKNIETGSLNSLVKVLNGDKYVYVEMVIKDEKRHSKFSLHGENICLNFFRAQTIVDDCICMPFDQIQKIIPEEPSLVFLELSLGNGIVKGRVLVRLDTNLPNIRANIVHIITGQCGKSLGGTVFNYLDDDEISASYLPFHEIPVTPDNSKSTTGKRGDIIGKFGKGYLEHLIFFIAIPPRSNDYGSTYRIFGHIEDGLDVIQDCYNNYSCGCGVMITDCGLVIEQE